MCPSAPRFFSLAEAAAVFPSELWGSGDCDLRKLHVKWNNDNNYGPTPPTPPMNQGHTSWRSAGVQHCKRFLSAGKKIIKATSMLLGFLGCPHDLSPLKFCSPEAADSFIWMGATGPGDYSITISDASSAITLRIGNCPSPTAFFCAAIIHHQSLSLH